MNFLSRALLLCFLLGVAESAWAGGFSVTTFGSRRTGMLTNLGRIDDATALFHNPAALSLLEGHALHLSASVSFTNAEFDIQALDSERFPEIACDEGADSCQWPVGQDGYYTKTIEPLSTMGVLPYAGFALDLGRFSEVLEDVVISAAVTAPNVYAGELPADGPSSYFFVEGYFVVISTIFGVGWRINDIIAIGGNVSYNYMRLSYARNFSLADMLRGRDGSGSTFVADTAQTTLGDVRLDFLGIDHGVGFTLSTLIQPISWLSMGLSFTYNTKANLEGDATVSPIREDVTQENFDNAVEAFGYGLPSGLNVEMTIPPYLSAGVNIHPSEYFEVGFDARFWLYNFFKKRTIIPIYENETATQTVTQEQLSQDMNYSLSFDLSLGFLVRPLAGHGKFRHFQLMTGVGFDYSPVPDEYFNIENPSLHNWRIAAGIRWYPPRGFRAALTYMYFGYVERNVTTSKTSPPLNAIGRGNNQFPRLELEYVF